VEQRLRHVGFVEREHLQPVEDGLQPARRAPRAPWWPETSVIGRRAGIVPARSFGTASPEQLGELPRFRANVRMFLSNVLRDEAERVALAVFLSPIGQHRGEMVGERFGVLELLSEVIQQHDVVVALHRAPWICVNTSQHVAKPTTKPVSPTMLGSSRGSLRGVIIERIKQPRRGARGLLAEDAVVACGHEPRQHPAGRRIPMARAEDGQAAVGPIVVDGGKRKPQSGRRRGR